MKSKMDSVNADSKKGTKRQPEYQNRQAKMPPNTLLAPHWVLILCVLLTGTMVACGGGNTAVGADNPPEQQDPGNNPAPGNDPIDQPATGTPTVTHPPEGNVNASQGGTIGAVTTRLTDAQFNNQFSAPPNRTAAPTDTIAYFDDGNANAVSFRLISGDGTNDRQFMTIPNRSVNGESPNAMFESLIVDGLAWRPDGTEITFSSNFEVGTGRADIYATSIDGSNLRRLTNVPRPIAYANYPQGTVELNVQYPDLNSGLAVGYFTGAQQAFGWLGFSQERRTIRFQAADLGPGVRQQAVLMNFGICYYDLVNDLDVIAGQTITAPRLMPPTILSIGYPCPQNYSAQWINNDQLAFIYRDHVGRSITTAFSPAFSIRSSPADNLSPTTPTPEVTRYTTFDRQGDQYFNIVEGYEREFVMMRMRRNANDFLLIDQVGSPLPNREDKVFLGSMNNPSSSQLRQVSICPDSLNCDVIDAEWVPGEFAFAYTSIDSLNRASLRLYTEVNGQASHQTLTSVADGRLGRFAVSPDGSRVVVERQFSVSTDTQLWMFDRNSGSFSEFVSAGRAPAWR